MPSKKKIRRMRRWKINELVASLINNKNHGNEEEGDKVSPPSPIILYSSSILNCYLAAIFNFKLFLILSSYNCRKKIVEKLFSPYFLKCSSSDLVYFFNSLILNFPSLPL